MIIQKEAITLIHTDTETIGISETGLQSVLSEDELERAGKFRFDKDRKRFIIRRGLLRTMLGTTFGIDPRTIRFSSSSTGKPFLAWPENTGIWFNISYSDNQIVYAFSKHPETGIDIERIRTVDDIDRLARNYFSAEEYSLILNLPAWEKNKAFIRIWSIKEALIKASGWELEHGLLAFDVAAQYRMNRFEVPLGDTMTLTCFTPVFDLICGYATVLAIRLDDSEPLVIHRYTLQNGEYIEL